MGGGGGGRGTCPQSPLEVGASSTQCSCLQHKRCKFTSWTSTNLNLSNSPSLMGNSPLVEMDNQDTYILRSLYELFFQNRWINQPEQLALLYKTRKISTSSIILVIKKKNSTLLYRSTKWHIPIYNKRGVTIKATTTTKNHKQKH